MQDNLREILQQDMEERLHVYTTANTLDSLPEFSQQVMQGSSQDNILVNTLDSLQESYSARTMADHLQEQFTGQYARQFTRVFLSRIWKSVC